MTYTISVVIPVYNGEAFIARAITSVLEQTIRPFEIVVVNDGSKDRTAEQLLKFGDTITVITIANGGVSNARNRGILACTGDLIAFLDADDIWYKEKLKLQLDVFEHYPDVGFVCCDYLWFNHNASNKESHFLTFKEDVRINFDKPIGRLSFNILISNNIVGTCSNVIVKRKVMEIVGLFNVNYKQAEDYDYWIRCSMATDLFFQSAVLLEKMTHESNLTNNFLETLLCHEQVLLNLQFDVATRDSVNAVRFKYLSELANVRYEIGNLYYENKQIMKAFNYFFKGLGTSLNLSNMKSFSIYFGKKTIRFLSFNLIRRKRSNC
jgi:glycosyltransferase involved in cell wall biosynthesis